MLRPAAIGVATVMVKPSHCKALQLQPAVNLRLLSGSSSQQLMGGEALSCTTALHLGLQAQQASWQLQCFVVTMAAAAIATSNLQSTCVCAAASN